MEGVQHHPRDGRSREKEHSYTYHIHVMSSVLGVLNLRCSWIKWGRCLGGNCTLESGGNLAEGEYLKVGDVLQP